MFEEEEEEGTVGQKQKEGKTAKEKLKSVLTKHEYVCYKLKMNY